MDTRNTTEETLTGAGREDNEPPAGYGGQEEVDESATGGHEGNEAGSAGDVGRKQGASPRPGGVQEPPSSER